MRKTCIALLLLSTTVGGCRTPLDALAQSTSGGLKFELYLEKDTFYEDEPIFYMLKLTNTDERPIWVSPFTLWGNQLLFRFIRQPGGELMTDAGLDYYNVYGEAARGDSLGPGESFYQSANLNHHGQRAEHYEWTGKRTLPPGDYRLDVTYLSDLRGAVFGEGDPKPLLVSAQVRIVPRGPAENEEFQEVLDLHRRLGRYREPAQSRMSAEAVRDALRSAEVFLRSHPQSPFAPLVYSSFIAQLQVRAAFAEPPTTGEEFGRYVGQIRSIAAAQAPWSLTRLHIVMCESEERRRALLAQIEEAAEQGSGAGAQIARVISEFIGWATSVDPRDPRASVRGWWTTCQENG